MVFARKPPASPTGHFARKTPSRPASLPTHPICLPGWFPAMIIPIPPNVNPAPATAFFLLPPRPTFHFTPSLTLLPPLLYFRTTPPSSTFPYPGPSVRGPREDFLVPLLERRRTHQGMFTVMARLLVERDSNPGPLTANAPSVESFPEQFEKTIHEVDHPAN